MSSKTFQVPDYYDIVTNPIDLQAMKEKCEDGVYESAQEFVDDMALLFDNGDLYNKVHMFIWNYIHRLGFIICLLRLSRDHLPLFHFYVEQNTPIISACGYIISIFCTISALLVLALLQ